MRVNIYAEEMTDRLEIVSKTIDGQEFTGLRFYLYTPVTIPILDREGKQIGVTLHQGPFRHREGDDDSSAVTFWGKGHLRDLLDKAKKLLDDHYSNRKTKNVSDSAMFLVKSLTPVYYAEKEGDIWKKWNFGGFNVLELESLREHKTENTIIINSIRVHALLFELTSQEGMVRFRWDCITGWNKNPVSIEY